MGNIIILLTYLWFIGFFFIMLFLCSDINVKVWHLIIGIILLPDILLLLIIGLIFLRFDKLTNNTTIGIKVKNFFNHELF